jgi:Na+-translocating ferredoxin:NAD+ oxidoreductase RnfG subunit
MEWRPAGIWPLVALGAALSPVVAAARVYLSVPQAQHAIFGDQVLTAFPVALTPAQQDAVRKAADGGWLVIDEVVGKHEMITYAVGIDADGAVRRVEVMEYQESYGQEVAEARWLRQFVGKDRQAPLRLGQDVEAISGATLSAKHLSDGVRRVLAVHALLLRGH